MITLLYPKEDWTASELSTKLQALASARDVSFYTTPKHGRRDEEVIGTKLADTDRAIFLAHDRTSLDRDTRWELDRLVENQVEIYVVAPRAMKEKLESLGVEEDSIYSYEEGDFGGFRNQINSLMKKLQAGTEGKKKGDLAAFLILLGLLLLLLWLLMETEE